MKKFVILSTIPAYFLMLAAIALALPTAKIKTLGISPRMVAADTSDIYTHPSSSLPNVGVGQYVYLAGNEGDTSITGWTWTLAARPNNSEASLSATDEAVVTLVPDVIGTYRVNLQVTSDSGQSVAVQITINSANYVGIGGLLGEDVAVPKCAACHNGQVSQKVEPWSGTRHAQTFPDAIEGRLSNHFSAGCVKCHTTGYFDEDPGADNQAFDDRAREEDWVFLDSANGGMREGVWDSMKVHYPQTAMMANVQCENCHGPGSGHMGMLGDNKIAVSWDVGVCARCHDSGSHHINPMQWRLSKHSHPVDNSSRGTTCAPCHGGKGFVDKLDGVPDSLLNTEYVAIPCATCHDPHDATNEHQLRTTEPYTLLNGEVYDRGRSNICVNCHHSRSVNTVAAEGNLNSRYGPHHGPQSEMLKGTNAFDMGGQVENSPHYAILENGCVDCHMAESPSDPNDPEKYLILGGHTFAVKTEEGAENTEFCATCHGEVESFASIGDEDWDEDGEVEGARAEIAGLMERLAMALPPVGEPTVSYPRWLTPTQRQALWNYKFVLEDKSGGMHNAKFAKSILLNAINADLGVEPIEGGIPVEYSLSNAFPNPFNPVSTFTYNLANDGKVSIKVFDMVGREIRIIVSEDQKAGTYRAAVNLAGRPSGVYVLQMNAGEFTASRKLVLVK